MADSNDYEYEDYDYNIHGPLYDIVNKGKTTLGTIEIDYADVRLDQYAFDVDFSDEKDEAFYSGIGLALVSFGYFESVLNRCIIKMISDRSDDRGFAIVSLLELRQKLDLFFNDMGPILVDDGLDIKGMHSKLLRVIEIRNLIAHADWSTLTNDNYVRCQIRHNKNDASIRFRYYNFSKDILHRISKEVYEICDNFIDDLSRGSGVSSLLYDVIDEYQSQAMG